MLKVALTSAGLLRTSDTMGVNNGSDQDDGNDDQEDNGGEMIAEVHREEEGDNCQWHPGKISHVCIVSYRNVEKIVVAIELSYIGQDCYVIPRILGKIYGFQTRRLDISFNSIRSLEGLEMFPALEEIILDNNDLNDSAIFISLPHLQTLSLNKNHFADLEALLEQLVKCYPKLSYLSLLGNPACPDQLSNLDKSDEDYQRYRYYVLYRIPGLKFLDSTPVKVTEKTEAKRVGSYMKVVKPTIDIAQESVENEDDIDSANYSPLPPLRRREGTHKGSFGKLRQRYTGTQSEGNRFIRDNEL